MGTVAALWQGQVPLARTAWIYGGLALLLFLSPLVTLSLLGPAWLQSPPVVALSLFVLVYSVFIAVAIWRSANNYQGWFAWRALAKGSVVVVALQTAAQLAAG